METVVINGVEYNTTDDTNLIFTDTITHLQSPESNIYTGRGLDGVILDRRKYDIIYADPPWTYKVWRKNTNNGKGQRIRIAEAFYDIMSLDDIMKLPVADICNKDALLFLWTTSPCIPEALKVIEAWGFEFKTIGFIWVKTQGEIAIENKLGLGHYTRPNGECILLAGRGQATNLIYDHSVQQVHYYPIQDHSRKPDQFAYLIDRLVGNVRPPYMGISKIEPIEPPEPKRCIELFARDAYTHLRDNWSYWGLEA